MGALFIARRSRDVTEYTSRRTGKTFKLFSEANGDFTVEGGGFITATSSLANALRFIELADAA